MEVVFARMQIIWSITRMQICFYVLKPYVYIVLKSCHKSHNFHYDWSYVDLFCYCVRRNTLKQDDNNGN